MAESNELRESRPWVYWGTLLGPFLALGLGILLCGLLAGWSDAAALFGWVGATFFALGKFVVLTPTNHWLFTPLFFAAMVVVMDMLTAIVCVFHVGWLFRIPRLGPRLAAVQEDGRFILSQAPWMRRATTLAIVLFVMFPLTATGAVGGAIFGRLLGLSRRRTLVGTFLGAVLGAGVMLGAAEAIRPLYETMPPAWRIVAGLAIIGAMIALINLRYRQLKRRRQEATPPG